MAVPQDLRFTIEHEWLRPDGDRARAGITEYAAHQLGDIVYVDLPRVGTTVAAGEAFGTVESVKAASDLFSPASGTIAAVNEALSSNPELVNTDPYGDGWMVEITLTEPGDIDSLMDATAYEALLAEEG